MSEEKAAPETNPVKKLRGNPKSRAAAVKAMCSQCMGCSDEHVEPGFRASIRDCTATACALYGFRPYR